MKNYLRILKAIRKTCKNWIEITYKKILKLPIEKIVLRNGITFFIDGVFGPAELSMLSEIWYDRYYTRHDFEIKAHDTVFDIGANNGFFTLYASSKANLGKIYCFEPLPRLYEKIVKNIGSNKIQNIVCEKIAIAKNTGKRNFFVSSVHSGCHSLYQRAETGTSIEISTISLEEYCKKNNIGRIDFLKMDCEGAEYEIILNLNTEFLSKTVKKIAMEYHDTINEHSHDEIVKFLQKNGFIVYVDAGYLYAKKK